MPSNNSKQSTNTQRTLIEKIWSSHVIATDIRDVDLLHIDRCLLTDLSGTLALEQIKADGRAVAQPNLNLAIPDHMIDTGCEGGISNPVQARWINSLNKLSTEAGIRLLDRHTGSQGIVHVVGLETGFCLPGTTIVCGDSHTSTNGAIGALAWGIGSTEAEHVLATQTLWLSLPKQARITISGSLQHGVTAKDVALYVIRELGPDFGREHAIEFAGPTVRRMSIAERATLCNMAIELGARFAIIAPDQTTVDYLYGQPLSPVGTDWKVANDNWESLYSDPDAHFGKDVHIFVSHLSPQITWGTTLGHVIGIGEAIPTCSGETENSLRYMGVNPGELIANTPIQYVFIGSCTNSRLDDLIAASLVVRGRKVAAGVKAWIVPGSQRVKQLAEGQGLDKIFIDAGFEWRHPGCSMCVSANGDNVPAGARCVSTSNRNFIGRQGPGARTHLASPLTAAASAIAGRIADPREYLGQAVIK